MSIEDKTAEPEAVGGSSSSPFFSSPDPGNDTGSPRDTPLLSALINKQALLTLLLGVVILLAFALRVHHLGRQSFWYDEGFNVFLVSSGWNFLVRITALSNQPPLQPVLFFFWSGLAGTSEFAARYFSLCWGVLTIPLLYCFARRLRLRWMGLPGVLLLAVAPFHIWYSQETREYTPAVFLTLLSLYFFVELLRQPQAPLRSRVWAGYILSTLAALYSHYYDIFFPLVQNVVFALFALPLLSGWLRRRQPAPVVLRWVVAQLLLAALFLPWALNGLVRLGVDKSYFPGTLPPAQLLGSLVNSFGTGETLPEELRNRVGPVFLVFALLGLLLLVLRALLLWKRSAEGGTATGSDHRISYLAPLLLGVLLLLPVAAVAIISYHKPKFSPRYLIMLLPIYDLLIGTALALPFTWLLRNRGSLPLIKWGRVLGVAPAALLAASSLVWMLQLDASSLQLMYTNPAYQRDNYRALIATLKPQLQTGDSILLISGHMFPVFMYYFHDYHGDIPWYPLPSIYENFVDNVDEATMAAKLTEISAGQRRLWLITWQNFAADPSETIQHLLDENTMCGPRQQWGSLGLSLYTLSSTSFVFPSHPVIQHPSNLTYANVLLLGYTVAPPASKGEPLHFILDFQALTPLQGTYTAHLRLLSHDGKEMGSAQSELGTSYYRPGRWFPGKIVRTYFTLPLSPAATPGEYNVFVSLFPEDRWRDTIPARAADGKLAGRQAFAGTVDITR